MLKLYKWKELINISSELVVAVSVEFGDTNNIEINIERVVQKQW